MGFLFQANKSGWVVRNLVLEKWALLHADPQAFNTVVFLSLVFFSPSWCRSFLLNPEFIPNLQFSLIYSLWFGFPAVFFFTHSWFRSGNMTVLYSHYSEARTGTWSDQESHGLMRRFSALGSLPGCWSESISVSPHPRTHRGSEHGCQMTAVARIRVGERISACSGYPIPTLGKFWGFQDSHQCWDQWHENLA